MKQSQKQTTTVVVGAQWGDEGKGKLVDYLSEDYKLVARYQGGGNAGHTVVVEGEKHVFHLVPSASFRDKTVIMGNGMVLDIEALSDEIETVEENDNYNPEIKISSKAHATLPYHRSFDVGKEKKSDDDDKIGTTKKGIGPTYQDKANRYEALRLEDLKLEKEELREKVLEIIEAKKRKLIEYNVVDSEEELEEYKREVIETTLDAKDKITPYITETSSMINQKIRQGDDLLCEGAQGTLLDIDHGSYPFVTSSNPTAGGACTGLGIGPLNIDNVVGVSKAYITRVGEGGLPTELTGETGEEIRERGGEFGATTGRPRRCGWLDLVALKYAEKINGFSGLALTKLDVLGGIDPIKVAVAYETKNEKETTDFSVDLEQIEPVYKEFSGWPDLDKEEWIKIAQGEKELPEEAKKFVEFVESELGVPVKYLSVGPEREATLKYD